MLNSKYSRGFQSSTKASMQRKDKNAEKGSISATIWGNFYFPKTRNYFFDLIEHFLGFFRKEDLKWSNTDRVGEKTT